MTALRPAVPHGDPYRPTDPGPRLPRTRDARGTETWEPTRALGRAVVLVAFLLVIGVLLGRVDMVVLAAPFALGAALGLWARPRRAPIAALRVAEELLSEGSEVHATVSVGNPDPVGFDLVVVRLTASRYLRFVHLDRPYVTAVAGGSASDLALHGRALRWGRHSLGPAVAHAVVADGLLVSSAAWSPSLRLGVYPATEDFKADDAMPRAAGLVGAHRSRRPGEGGELAGVRMFAPGDRLRRIDWRVTLRTGQLHVAATLSDRDAEVVLLLDLLHEAGRSGGLYGSRSVLDTTVRAAAGIAEHYLQRGDRVALLEYTMRGRRLRAASGRRQYLTVLEWLLDVQSDIGGMEAAPVPQQFSSNALVVVLTPLLDPRSAAMLAGLARSGRFVVAVDTMPPDLALPVRHDWGDLPGRLWRLERDNTVDLLREHGVPVVAWAGAGSLDQVLRLVARMASAPRAVPK